MSDLERRDLADWRRLERVYEAAVKWREADLEWERQMALNPDEVTRDCVGAANAWDKADDELKAAIDRARAQ